MPCVWQCEIQFPETSRVATLFECRSRAFCKMAHFKIDPLTSLEFGVGTQLCRQLCQQRHHAFVLDGVGDHRMSCATSVAMCPGPSSTTMLWHHRLLSLNNPVELLLVASHHQCLKQQTKQHQVVPANVGIRSTFHQSLRQIL